MVLLPFRNFPEVLSTLSFFLRCYLSLAAGDCDSSWEIQIFQWKFMSLPVCIKNFLTHAGVKLSHLSPHTPSLRNIQTAGLISWPDLHICGNIYISYKTGYKHPEERINSCCSFLGLECSQMWWWWNLKLIRWPAPHITPTCIAGLGRAIFFFPSLEICHCPLNVAPCHTMGVG